VNDNKFLLHICCAPCSPHPIRELKKQFELTLYFFNPNIHPKKEYLARLVEAEKLAFGENMPLIAGEYRPREWFQNARQWKDEPERGKRCEFCIGHRLFETARMAAERGIARFGTALTVSRLKSAIMLNSLGEKAQAEFRGKGIVFYEADWKKKDGFNISAKLSDEMGFVRQDFCGCVYSRKNSRKKGQSEEAGQTA